MVRCPKCGCVFTLRDEKKKFIREALASGPKRFNALQRLTQISRPYLLDLLVEMRKTEGLTRTQIAKQNVVYALAWCKV